MTHYKNQLILFLSSLNLILAQGVGFPDAPSQAPIGGLGLLAAAGGAMAYKKLKNKK
jgi:hypothetical protein